MLSLKKLMQHYADNPLPKNNSTATNVHEHLSRIFILGDKKLAFIASAHAYSGRKSFLDLLDKTFMAVKPQIVLLETDYTTRQPQLLKRLSHPKRSWSEVERGIIYAKKYRALFRGMDESTDIQSKIMMSLKPDGPKLLTFITFYYTYKSIKNRMHANNSILKNDAYLRSKYYFIADLESARNSPKQSRYLNCLIKFKKQYRTNSFDVALEKLFREVVHKYIGRISLLNALNRDLSTQKYKINYYLDLFNGIRERRMYESCVKALNTYDRVVVISGAWHTARLEQVFNWQLDRKGADYESYALNAFLKTYRKGIRT